MLGSNGSRHTYQFRRNGAVEYTGIMNVMTGGCNMQVFKTMKGRANLERRHFDNQLAAGDIYARRFVQPVEKLHEKAACRNRNFSNQTQNRLRSEAALFDGQRRNLLQPL
jgi:hypothetical protein